jgi:CRP-like cAMP-binding protein
MEKYLDILRKIDLFSSMQDTEILKAVQCLKGVVKSYNKNEEIFLAGDKITKLGIVLSGSVLITKDDIMGNRNILTIISKSGMFGESFVLSNAQSIPVSVICDSRCEILFLEFNSIIRPCESNCDFHNTLIRNMLNILASKNILLNNKIEILSSKTTRDKLMTYFNMQVITKKSNKFQIPFDREALADFLNVNRSSMSRELSKMQEEGIIRFNKNKFEILL